MGTSTPNPYEPPRTPDGNALPAAGASGLVGAFALACFAISVVLQWIERALELLANDSGARLSVLAATYVRVEVVAMVARVVGGVAFLVWIYRAAQRAHEQGRKGLTLSPGWCVACFFVPVAMLFVPYQAMSGIATAADPQERGHAPGYVFVWWATYLASLGLLAFGGNSFVVSADLDVELVATALATGALVALWATMRFIRRGQAHWAAHDAAVAAAKPRRRRRRAGSSKAGTSP